MKAVRSPLAFGAWLGVAAVVLGATEPSRPAAGAEPGLVRESMIPLEQVAGRIDHMTFDLARRRLYVAELGNDTVDEIDLVARKVVRRIVGLAEPQGLAFLPDEKLLAVANAGDGKLSFFHVGDLSPAGSIAFGGDADNLHMDATGKQLIVGYGQGGLAVIDPANRRLLADIQLPAHPEGFQLNPAGTRAFINLPDAREIGLADLAAGHLSAVWPTPWARGNFPMAIDRSGKILAIGFRDPAILALVDAASGSLVDRIDSCGDADDLFFDDQRQRIYESCGDGVVDVYAWRSGRLSRLGRLPTSSGTRTSLFVPELDRLFVAERAPWLDSRADVLIFRPSP